MFKKYILFFFIINTLFLYAEKIVLVTNEWKPFISKEYDNYGPLPEKITKIFVNAGIEVEYKFYPWRRCEELIKSGEAFGTFPYIKTSKREKEYYFSNIILESVGRLFFLKENINTLKWNKYEDLKNYKVGGVFGYWYEEPFKKAGLSVDYSSSEVIAVNKLYSMRVDLIAGDENVIWEIINKNFPEETDKFDVSEKEINSNALHLITSKNNKKNLNLIKRFNKSLKNMKKEGKI